MSANLEQTPEDLAFLVGATIHKVGVARDDFGGEEFLVLEMTTQAPVETESGSSSHRVKVQVWQDEEGNGPGYLALDGGGVGADLRQVRDP